MNRHAQIAMETLGLLLIIAGGVGVLLAIGWFADWGFSERTTSRITAIILIVSFVVLLALTTAFIYMWRTDQYVGRPSSSLHLPLTWSFAAVAMYFGIFCVDAIDVFLHDRSWPLLRDPEVRLITRLLLITIVVPRWWLLWRIYWGERRARESLAVPPDLDDREFGEVPVR